MGEAFLEWARCAGVRALKSAAQGALAVISTTAIAMSDVSWAMVASSACLTAVLSVLTSLAGIPEACGGASVVALGGGAGFGEGAGDADGDAGEADEGADDDC